MDTNRLPKIFLSHAHADKRVARRLVRRLSAHGIKVWIDERELRVGTRLTTAIRDQIENSDGLLVVASKASADSKWVGLEIEFAREHGKTIIPLFIDPLDRHERFRDYLGVDAVSPQTFADKVYALMLDLSLSFDCELPPADPVALKDGLRELAKEEPDLAPLILGCLDAQGLHQENMDTALTVSFHGLDEAINSLFDLRPDHTIAYHAAYSFLRAGAGVRALSLWIKETGDGELPLVTAVGNTAIEPTIIPTAILLLTGCNPPNNHALYKFINNNAAQLDDIQRRTVIRLVTWPVRTNTERLCDVLGWVAFKHFPKALEIQQMWIRWIHDGVFDGGTSSPRDLAHYTRDAVKEGVLAWKAITEALQQHVRLYLRSGDKNKVNKAVDHIIANADTGTPVLDLLLLEASGVSGTSEWNEWRKREPETAEMMQWFVNGIVKEAKGDQNWLQAWKSAEQMVVFNKRRRQMLD